MSRGRRRRTKQSRKRSRRRRNRRIRRRSRRWRRKKKERIIVPSVRHFFWLQVKNEQHSRQWNRTVIPRTKREEEPRRQKCQESQEDVSNIPCLESPRLQPLTYLDNVLIYSKACKGRNEALEVPKVIVSWKFFDFVQGNVALTLCKNSQAQVCNSLVSSNT